MTMSRIISIIGAGAGHAGLLTEQVTQIIKTADEVYASGKIAGTLITLRDTWRVVPFSDMKELAMESKKQHIVLLLEGDSLFFDKGEQLYNELKGYADVKCYAGISSVQYLCAKTNQSYDNIYWLEYESEDLLAAISYNKKVAVLLSGENIPDHICRMLCDAGLSNIRVTVGSKIATGRERIVQDEAKHLRDYEFANPSVMIIENPNFNDKTKTIFDNELKLCENALTQEVRWNASNLMRIQPTDKIINIGAGSGEMAVELARMAYKGSVIAIEENSQEFEMLKQNKENLGLYNISALYGNALEMLEHNVDIIPDAVFVGDNVRGIKRILQSLKHKNDKIRVVIVAHNLERLSEAQSALSSLRFAVVDVSQLTLSRGKVLGSHTMMLSDKPMFLLFGGKDLINENIDIKKDE